MKKVLVITLVMLMVLSIALTGCAPKQGGTTPGNNGGGSGTAVEPQELTINLFQEGETYNWPRASSSNSAMVYNWTMEGLTRTTPNGQVTPGIAEKWDISPDGMTWTFHLRDAKWSDGQPVTAKDFKYSWMKAIDPKEPHDYTYFLYDIQGAEDYSNGKTTADKVGINVLDDKTIEVKLEHPVTYFDYLVSFMTYAPIRQDVYEKYGENFNAEAQYFVTDGPFTVKSWQHEAEMVFVKNPDYWDAANIKLEKVTGVMIADDQTEFNMYEAGELDHTIQLTAEQKQAMTKGNVQTFSDGSVWFLAFNLNDPVLKNVNIRKALTYAIDRDSFIKNVAKQPWKPALAFIQPDVIPGEDGKTPWRDTVPSYFKDNDIETAKQLLAQGMKELGITSIPKMKFMCNDNAAYQSYCQAIQEMWKKNLNVEVEIEPVPSAVRIDRVQKHDYDLAYFGWGPDYPDPMTDLDLFVTGGGNNYSDYKNPEYDNLIKSAKAEPDRAKKYVLMRKAEDLLMQDMVIGPIAFRYKDYAVREYVKNFERGPFLDTQFIYSSIEGKSK